MLGGGFLQTYVINKAKQLGCRVLVLDADPQAPGFQLADDYAVINIVDENACLKYAQSQGVDGVLTAATDFGVLSMSRIAETMGLPGINYKSAQRIKNKAAVRKCLYDAGADDTGYSFEIDSFEKVPYILSQIKFPVMIKPCDGSGSRGASRVDSAEGFAEACRYAMSGSISNHAVAEPFVEGREYGVESFVDHGRIHILGIMHKDMTMPPYYAELGHSLPSGLTDGKEEIIKDCVTKAIVALEINHGSVNMDLLVSEDGSVHIVDVGARMGGNLIGSHIVPIGTGVDYMGNMIRAAVGESTDFSLVSAPCCVATRLLALTPGKVKALPDFEEIEQIHGVKIEHHLRVGDIIKEYHTNLDGCGYVVATGKEQDGAKRKAETVKSIIDRLIIRE